MHCSSRFGISQYDYNMNFDFPNKLLVLYERQLSHLWINEHRYHLIFEEVYTHKVSHHFT
jgi:hypothetical protein